jgi:hypothetical protein
MLTTEGVEEGVRPTEGEERGVVEGDQLDGEGRAVRGDPVVESMRMIGMI